MCNAYEYPHTIGAHTHTHTWMNVCPYTKTCTTQQNKGRTNLHFNPHAVVAILSFGGHNHTRTHYIQANVVFTNFLCQCLHNTYNIRGSAHEHHTHTRVLEYIQLCVCACRLMFVIQHEWRSAHTHKQWRTLLNAITPACIWAHTHTHREN